MRVSVAYGVLAVLASVLLPRAGAGDGAGGQEGDLVDLTCRLVKVEAVSPDVEASLVSIEVRNAGEVSAEPVRFEVRAKPSARRAAPEAWTVRRTPDPVVGRAERAVAPRGTRSYPLLVPVAAPTLRGATVRVTAASFGEAPDSGGKGSAGPGKADLPIVVDDVTTDRVPDEAGILVWETTVRLRNLRDQPVDGVFLATLKEPPETRLLLARRLGPKEAAAWVLRDAPLALHEGAARRLTGIAVRQMKLVDWSVVTGDGRAEGAAALTAAWKRWIRWEEPFPSVRGRFNLRIVPGGAGVAPPSASVAGRFTLDSGGRVTCEADTVVLPERRQAAEAAITEAFADLRRRGAADAVAAASPSLVERGRLTRIRCEAAPSGDRGPAFVYRLEEGILRGWEDPDAPDAIHETWTSTPFGDGYVVTARALVQRAIGGGKRPVDARRWAYADLAGRVVPTRYVRAVSWTGAEPDEVALDLAEMEVVGEAPTPPPGEAPAALREAWDSPYRHPAAAVDLTARFQVESVPTEALWHGERSVSGRLSLTHFTGMRPDASAWQRADVEVEGDFPPDKRRALADLVEDRLHIWAHRDFSGRPPFDVAFRGARITPRPGEPGVFDVANGPCTAILVREGRVVGWDAPGLTGGDLTYARVGTTYVHSALRRGESYVEARFQDLGGGWIVPVEMRFERVFGPEWGPETVRLFDVEIAPPDGG